MLDLNLKKSVTLSFAFQILGMACGYLLQVLLARWMGSREYGIYACSIAWATSLASLAALGLPYAALRFVPEYHTASNWPSMKGFIGFAYASCFSVGVACGLVCLLTAKVFHVIPPSVRLE